MQERLFDLQGRDDGVDGGPHVVLQRAGKVRGERVPDLRDGRERRELTVGVPEHLRVPGADEHLAADQRSLHVLLDHERTGQVAVRSGEEAPGLDGLDHTRVDPDVLAPGTPHVLDHPDRRHVRCEGADPLLGVRGCPSDAADPECVVELPRASFVPKTSIARRLGNGAPRSSARCAANAR